MSTYRVPVMEKFAWQDPVKSILNTPPGSPVKGDRYIVGSAPEGDWAANAGKIAWYDGSAWKFDTAAEGWKIFNSADLTLYTFTALAWTNATVIGNLTISGTGIDSSANEVDWDLKDNVASALEFVTETNVSMLNMDTTDNAEKVTVGVDLAVTGDLDFSNASKTVALNAAASAISFDTTSAILSINGTNGEEVVTAHKDMVVAGNLTVQGTTTTINTEDLLVKDKLITLNDGGTDASITGAGIEVEGTDNAIKAYLKLGAADSTIWDLMASNGNVLTIDINATETLTIAGSLDVEADSAINQDVTTDASPTFNNLVLNGGDVTITADSTSAFAITDGVTDILAIDSTTGSKKVMITGNLTVTTGDVTLKSGGTIIDTNTDLTLTDHNNVSVTVAQAYTAYEDRAKYDSTLGCIVFPDSVDVI